MNYFLSCDTLIHIRSKNIMDLLHTFEKENVRCVPIIRDMKYLPIVINNIIIDFCLDDLIISDIDQSKTVGEYNRSVITARSYIKNCPLLPTVIITRLIFITEHNMNNVFDYLPPTSKTRALSDTTRLLPIHKHKYHSFGYTYQMCDLDHTNDDLTLKKLSDVVHGKASQIHPKTVKSYHGSIFVAIHNPFEQPIQFTLPEQEEFLEWQREQGLR